jgi:hypothetical protein
VCRYIVVENIIGELKVTSSHHDYNKAADAAEAIVLEGNGAVEVFERVSTCLPTTAVKWEGRKRPGAGA